MTRSPVSVWSEADIELLREYYPRDGSNIPELLSKFSALAILAKARKLGIRTNRKWTAEEIDLLREKYPVQGYNIPELLSIRSKTDIQNKAKSLGVRSQVRAWTTEEKQLLRERYSIDGPNIPELQKHHSRKSIILMACRLHLSSDVIANQISKRNGQLCKVRAAYTGTNRQDYVFAICSICNSHLILPTGDAMEFEHGAMCSKYKMPEF